MNTRLPFLSEEDLYLLDGVCYGSVVPTPAQLRHIASIVAKCMGTSYAVSLEAYFPGFLK